MAGLGNAVGANYATVVVGASNSVGLNATYGVVSGGQSNSIGGEFAAIGGGLLNLANGQGAAIPGGEFNSANGTNSFAAGTASNPATPGSFVWSDDAAGATVVKSSVANEFMARASGGFYLYSCKNLSLGMKLAPGSGSWSTLSDRTVKSDIVDVDAGRILAKVAALPISEWSYTAEGTGVRHLGPMAQDFYAAFGLGEDDRYIATVDEEGIALAAIKALHADLSAKDQQLAALDARVTRLEERLDALERSAPARWSR